MSEEQGTPLWLEEFLRSESAGPRSRIIPPDQRTLFELDEFLRRSRMAREQANPAENFEFAGRRPAQPSRPNGASTAPGLFGRSTQTASTRPDLGTGLFGTSNSDPIEPTCPKLELGSGPNLFTSEADRRPSSREQIAEALEAFGRLLEEYGHLPELCNFIKEWPSFMEFTPEDKPPAARSLFSATRTSGASQLGASAFGTSAASDSLEDLPGEHTNYWPDVKAYYLLSPQGKKKPVTDCVLCTEPLEIWGTLAQAVGPKRSANAPSSFNVDISWELIVS